MPDAQSGINSLPGITAFGKQGTIGFIYFIHLVILKTGIRITYKEFGLRVYFIIIKDLRRQIL